MLAVAAAMMLVPLTPTETLQKWVVHEMATRHIPGMAAAVYKRGKPLAIVTAGVCDLDASTPVTRRTQFEICSITKQFTAAAVLLLAQEGRLTLDAPISRYLHGIPSDWSGVTLRRLLNHTSGVPDTLFTDNLTDLPEGEAIIKLTSHPLEFRPGDRWSYNNTGYWLLGLAISHVFGEPYFDFVEKRICKPLGLKHTFPNRVEEHVPWRATGYSLVNGKYERASMLSDRVGNAAGGLISTIDDLNIWCQALRNGKLLNAESRKEMLEPAKLNSGDQACTPYSQGYGLGVFVGSANGHRYEKHSGGWDDASCQLTQFPDDELMVVLLTNRGGYEQRSFAGEMIAHLFVPSIHVPTWAAIEEPNKEALHAVGRAIENIHQGRMPPNAVPSATIWNTHKRQTLQDSFSGRGSLEKIEQLAAIRQGKYRVCEFRASYSPSVIVVATLDADNRLVDISAFEPPD